MKNNIKLWKKIVGCCLLAVLMYNCADDSYLIDGGKANPYYNGNMMQYLESRPDYLKIWWKSSGCPVWKMFLKTNKLPFCTYRLVNPW